MYHCHVYSYLEECFQFVLLSLCPLADANTVALKGNLRAHGCWLKTKHALPVRSCVPNSLLPIMVEYNPYIEPKYIDM